MSEKKTSHISMPLSSFKSQPLSEVKKNPENFWVKGGGILTLGSMKNFYNYKEHTFTCIRAFYQQ